MKKKLFLCVLPLVAMLAACNNGQTSSSTPSQSSEPVISSSEPAPSSSEPAPSTSAPISSSSEAPIAESTYEVRHMIETPEGFSLKDTETLTGKVGEKTVAASKTYAGYTASAFEQKTIEPNGTTVVEIKYNANTDTPFKAEHYLFDLKTDDFVLAETDDLAGKTGFQTAVEPKSYAGYELVEDIAQKSILADGSTIVKAEYKIKDEVELDKELLKFNIKGETDTLTALVDLPGYTWASSDEDVATVDEETGEVTAVGLGNALVYLEKGGIAIASAVVKCESPYINSSTGKQEYDFETGAVFVTGSHGNENNDFVIYDPEGKGVDQVLPENFICTYTAAKSEADMSQGLGSDLAVRLVTTKHNRGTAINVRYSLGANRVFPWGAGTNDNNGLIIGYNATTNNNWTGSFGSVLNEDGKPFVFERHVIRELGVICYIEQCENGSTGADRNRFFFDTLNERSDPAYTTNLSFGVAHAAGDDKGFSFSDVAIEGCNTGEYKLDQDILLFEKSETKKLTINKTENVVWESENNDYVTVDQEGNVTAKKLTGGKACHVYAKVDGEIVAQCVTVAIDPYINENQGTHTYDFATGICELKGTNGGENNDVMYYTPNMARKYAPLPENFRVTFKAQQTTAGAIALKIMSSKCSRGTAVNLAYNTSDGRLYPWTAGNWCAAAIGYNPVKDADGDTSNKWTGGPSKELVTGATGSVIELERHVLRDKGIIVYVLKSQNGKVDEYAKTRYFIDKINDNSDPLYTYAVGFGIAHSAGDGKGAKVSDVKITELNVGDVVLSDDVLIFSKGETKQLSVLTGQKVTWVSDAPSLATVDAEGKVTAVAPGSGQACTVYAKIDDKIVGECKVIVAEPFFDNDTTVKNAHYTYDFANGKVTIKGGNGSENVDFSYYSPDGSRKGVMLPDNFEADFKVESKTAGAVVFKVMSKASTNTALAAVNVFYDGSSLSAWVAGNNAAAKFDGGEETSVAAPDLGSGAVTFHFEREVDRAASTITYTITTTSGSHTFTDVLNENSTPDSTYAIGFGLKDGNGKNAVISNISVGAKEE